MTTLKQGDLIKDEDGMTHKVLGVCGEAVHLSYFNNHHDYFSTETEASLKAMGFTWDTPAWEPEIGMKYWYIDELGNVSYSRWNEDEIDHPRRDFLGIYETKELCEAALLKIPRKLGK